MSRWLDEIRALDPVRDAQRIVILDASYEFPWDTQRSLELAFYRTFAVPSIAELLDSTGEFTGRAQKRYDDTQILISAFCEFGYDSDLGRRAIRRMNQIHGRFEIANEDFLYVLSTMVFEPICTCMKSAKPQTEQVGRSRPSMRVRTSFVPSRGQNANLLAATQAFARRSFR